MTSNIISVQELFEKLDDTTLKDSKVLFEIMQRISASQPKMWNEHTIGFDEYHYKYKSGHEGDSQILSFYPRKGKITIYLMDGTTRYSELLSKLGRYTTTGYCIYIKQLSDIELQALEEILKSSYDFIKSLSEDGPIDRILWQTEK